MILLKSKVREEITSSYRPINFLTNATKYRNKLFIQKGSS